MNFIKNFFNNNKPTIAHIYLDLGKKLGLKLVCTTKANDGQATLELYKQLNPKENYELKLVR